MNWLTDTLFGTKELQATGDDLDNKLRIANEQAYARGLWTDSQYRQVQKNAADGATGDVSEQVYSSFKEGLTDSWTFKAGMNLAPLALIAVALYLLLLLKK